jgi:EAL domain-containing protein (putative c-di-GMP-specific phosphodiesterase class I)/CheY-like chemotaxis protein
VTGMDEAIVPSEIAEAVERGELVLHYQPEVSLRTDRVVGMEALVRWAHPRLGLQPPDAFIPLAEQGPEIAAVGSWVLHRACAEVAEWRQLGAATESLFVSVNVSAHQLTSDLVAVVTAALLETNCPPHSLILEVTETTAMADPERSRHIFERLGELGVRTAIDDFGTGYSSLAYLRRLPLHTIKIDRSFVSGLGVEPEDTAIVGAVVSMGHGLGRSVLAEGVETAVQLEQLRVLGCDLAQGFYFGRPTASKETNAVVGAVASGQWRPAGCTRGEGIWRSPSPVVLVADDSHDARFLVRTALATSGFAVHEAQNGIEALTMAKGVKPDCVVLDVEMPGMSGIEVLRHLRQDMDLDVAVVILSGRTGAGIRAEAYALGTDDYVVKPIAPRELVERVVRVLRGRSSTGA